MNQDVLFLFFTNFAETLTSLGMCIDQYCVCMSDRMKGVFCLNVYFLSNGWSWLSQICDGTTFEAALVFAPVCEIRIQTMPVSSSRWPQIPLKLGVSTVQVSKTHVYIRLIGSNLRKLARIQTESLCFHKVTSTYCDSFLQIKLYELPFGEKVYIYIFIFFFYQVCGTKKYFSKAKHSYKLSQL